MSGNEISEEFDMSFANGSMRDLAMRMKDIDKQLDDFASLDKSKSKELGASRTSLSEMSDRTVDDDDGLDEMRKELLEIQTAEEIYRAEGGGHHAAATFTATSDGHYRQESAPPMESKDPPGGRVEHRITATVIKPSPTNPIGLSMKTTNGVTRIVGIVEGGLVAQSSLQIGYELITINDVLVRNAKHARLLIQQAHDKVTIVTQQFSEDKTDAKAWAGM